MGIAETVESDPMYDNSRIVMAPIPIHTNEDGSLELPNITINDGHKAKIVQSMLRDYCTTVTFRLGSGRLMH
jgi:hypothetical protein